LSRPRSQRKVRGLRLGELKNAISVKTGQKKEIGGRRGERRLVEIGYEVLPGVELKKMDTQSKSEKEGQEGVIQCWHTLGQIGL